MESGFLGIDMYPFGRNPLSEDQNRNRGRNLLFANERRKVTDLFFD